MKQVTAVVHGRVQGVGFRASTQSQATRLSVRGWVANQYDGSVKVVAEGPDAELERLVSWLRRGPPAARVDRVDVVWSEGNNQFRGFQIRH